MYGLPQASLLANQQLVHKLTPAGFVPVRHTPGLFVHTSKPIMFALIVDDFGVQYVGKPAADFLISTNSPKRSNSPKVVTEGKPEKPNPTSPSQASKKQDKTPNLVSEGVVKPPVSEGAVTPQF